MGRFPTPTRSALTMGEFAKMINGIEGIGCELTVVTCEGWRREMYFGDTDLAFVPPSPNLPTVDTAFAYIGACILRGLMFLRGVVRQSLLSLSVRRGLMLMQ